MKDPHAQRTPEETDRKNLTSHGAAFEQGEDASPELERIWNAMQPKLAIIDQTLEALARYQARSAMRRKVKRTLLLVACALLDVYKRQVRIAAAQMPSWMPYLVTKAISDVYKRQAPR